LLKAFQKIGRELFLQGLNNSHSGNLSIRQGDRIFITRRGSMLANLTEEDIIETGIEKNDSNITLASTEIIVHRAIYQNTSALAIVHCHPPYAIALSLIEDDIIPIDSEGCYLFRKVPVLKSEYTIGSREVAKGASKILKKYRLLMIKGHGCIAIGQLLEEAYQWASSLEHSSKIIYITRTMKPDFIYKKTKDYHKW